MKTHHFLLLVVPIIATSFIGCYTMHLSATPADHPMSLSNQPQGNIVKHFTISTTIHHLIGGLITLNSANLAKDIDDEIKADGGTSAANIKVSYEMPFIYGLVNYITLDLYTPFELTVEGDAVK